MDGREAERCNTNASTMIKFLSFEVDDVFDSVSCGHIEFEVACTSIHDILLYGLVLSSAHTSTSLYWLVNGV